MHLSSIGRDQRLVIYLFFKPIRFHRRSVVLNDYICVVCNTSDGR